MKTYKIETRRGWFCRPETIGSVSFPLSLTTSFYGATVYLSKTCARRDMSKFNLKNCNIYEFEENYLRGKDNFDSLEA